MSKELTPEVIVVGNGVPKELTPIYELLTWLGENRIKIQKDGFWYVDISCKMASMLSKEESFIRKKEREAASKTWDAAYDRWNWIEEENPTDEVPNKQEFIDKNYPL
jgi:Tol biopolymer transport system component